MVCHFPCTLGWSRSSRYDGGPIWFFGHSSTGDLLLNAYFGAWTAGLGLGQSVVFGNQGGYRDHEYLRPGYFRNFFGEFENRLYFFQLIFFAGAVYFLMALKRSPFGLMLRGIRESESRMIMLGYRVALLRYAAFLFAALVAAVAGVFFTYFTGLINPHSVSLTTNVEALLAAILGGINTLAGVVVGTGVLKPWMWCSAALPKGTCFLWGLCFCS